jgi:hypothetical protein
MAKHSTRTETNIGVQLETLATEQVRQLRSRIAEMAPKLDSMAKRTVPTIGLRLDPAGLRKVG